MAGAPSPLDPRHYQELVDRLKFLLQGTEFTPGYLPEWSAEHDDAGMALVRTYARLMELVVQRLNRIPERNLMAFLDMVGVSQLPPGAARGPVTFRLGPNAAGGIVPAGTRVATVQTSTSPAVIYQVPEEFYLNPAAIVEAYSLTPQRVANRTGILTGKLATSFAPFEGEEPLEHHLYLGAPNLLQSARPFGLRLHLAGTSGAGELLQNLPWEFASEQGWQSLPKPHLGASAYGAPGCVLTFPEIWSMTERSVGGSDLGGSQSAAWLRARRLATARSEGSPLIQAVGLEVIQSQGIEPDLTLAGTAPIDVTAGFRPFGELPRGGEVLALSSAEALSVRGAKGGLVALEVAVETGDLQWEWKAWNLESTAVTPSELLTEPIDLSILADDTSFFGANGRVALTPYAELRPPLALQVRVTGGTYRRVPLLRQWRLAAGDWVAEPAALYRLDPGSSTWIALDPGQPFHPFGPEASVDSTFVVIMQATTKPVGELHQTITAPELDQFVRRTSKPEGFAETEGDPPLSLTAGARLDTTTASLQLEVSIAANAVIEWEYLGRFGWRPLGRSSVRHCSEEATPNFIDTTYGLTRSGHIAFRRPDDAVPSAVAGQSGVWIRARLSGGGYGFATLYETVLSGDHPGVVVKQGTGGSVGPAVRSLRILYNAAQPKALSLLQAYFEWVDRSANGSWQGAGQPYELFPPPGPTAQPGLYLGFDRAPGNTTLNLYASMPARQALEEIPVRLALDEGAQEEPIPLTPAGPGAPSLTWSCWDGRVWAPLTVTDGSYGFTEPGPLQLLLPPKMAPLARFSDRPLYWIRVTPSADEGASRMLSGLYLNTTRVVQAQTIRQEVLGSSTGRATQTFKALKPPILPGQVLMVREPERPSTLDEQRLIQEEGAGAVQERQGPDGLPEYWVRWHAVENLRLSDPHSRHYSIDRVGGLIQFGDGINGMVPPPGSGNLVLEQYASGGGASGNQPAGAVTQLKSTLPYVQSVINPEPLDGGSDPETEVQVRERGPHSVKHRNRAVTVPDLEWLALEAAGTRVARAKVLPGRNRELHPERGWVTVIVVPRGTDQRPLPSIELLDLVADYLAERSVPAVAGRTASRLNVIGPGYVPVSLAVRLQPTRLGDMESVRKRVLERLDRFLHPLTGGQFGRGWEFGRPVYLSEIYAALEAVEGVEHVERVAFRSSAAVLPLRFKADPLAPRLTGAASRGLKLALVEEPRVAVRLLESLPAESRVESAMTVHFREGELIRLYRSTGGHAGALPLYIRSIDGDRLRVDPFIAPEGFPAGRVVMTDDGGASMMTDDGGASSVLLEPLPAGRLTDSLRVQTVQLGQHLQIGPLSCEIEGFGGRLELGEHDLVYSGQHQIELVGEGDQ